MRIERVLPPPPPPEFRMMFSRDEGWAIVAAIREWAERHPNADEVDRWREWAKTIDKELRAGV